MENNSSYLFRIIILNLAIVFIESSTLCNEINGEIEKAGFATKTGYFSAYKDDTHWKEFRKQSAGCTPEKVWFFSRHGTRYPIRSDFDSFKKLPTLIEEIVYNHFQGQGCLTEEDVFEFKQWIPSFGPRDKGQLHEMGADEMFSMGKHWKDLFPEIFADPFNSSQIKVEFTVRNRTGQSAYHFLRGMYGDDAIGKIRLPEPYSPNFILRFYTSCPVWLRDVYQNNDTYRERILFQNSQVFQDMVRAVGSRLGYTNPLNLDKLITIYDQCRYETSWFPKSKSIWCLPFSQKDLEVLEYHQDLKYYYEDSYGIPLNKEIACRTISDLYMHLKSKVSSPGSLPNGVLYFSHDKAILKVQALLGLFSSKTPLTHTNFAKEHRFKSSRSATFAANLGFVLFRCGTTHKVAMFYAGHPLPLPSVCPKVVCDWGDYERFLEPLSANCDLTKLCMLHDEL